LQERPLVAGSVSSVMSVVLLLVIDFIRQRELIDQRTKITL
jgi:hypothetical protein